MYRDKCCFWEYFKNQRKEKSIKVLKAKFIRPNNTEHNIIKKMLIKNNSVI